METIWEIPSSTQGTRKTSVLLPLKGKEDVVAEQVEVRVLMKVIKLPQTCL